MQRQTCTIVQNQPRFSRWARTYWRTKPVENLQHLIGRAPRTCAYYVNGDRDPHYADMVALLRSEAGGSLLEHLMGTARPLWWRDFLKAKNLGTLRRELEEQRKRIAQMEQDL